jgi:hypothetical protein
VANGVARGDDGNIQTVSPGAVKGQAMLIDLGSPYSDGFVEPVQIMLLQNESFVQSAEAPDEPVVLNIPGAVGGTRDIGSGRTKILEALRTHYKLFPFRISLRGLLMEGKTMREAEKLALGARPLKAWPGKKISQILQLIRDAHLLSYASTTMMESGMGTGFIENLVITEFVFDKDNQSSNVSPFTLTLQQVTATEGEKGLRLGDFFGGPSDKGQNRLDQIQRDADRFRTDRKADDQPPPTVPPNF